MTQKNKTLSVFENTLRLNKCATMDVFKTNNGLTNFKPFKESENIQTAKAFPAVVNKNNTAYLEATEGGTTTTKSYRVAVLFSGGPAPGGHNVIAGLKKIFQGPHCLYGVKAGPKGLLQGDLFVLTDDCVANKFNLGGFDLLGSDRTKIKTEAQFECVKKTVLTYKLNAIVIIGGDDSNTNALFLAEKLAELDCQVIGVPKTIDGDLQVGNLLPISFGFDTACKVYSEMVGNILQDTPSSRKYWHVVKLMGRSASHIALEVGLKTRAQITLISEEVLAQKLTLKSLAQQIADVVIKRSKAGKNYGVILIPEGLIEFIPEYRDLIQRLNDVIAINEKELTALNAADRFSYIVKHLSKDQQQLMQSMPVAVRDCLLMDRDAHGNVQVSQIPTEELVIYYVEDIINKQVPFNTNRHFFGYEGRCAAPSCFDASLTYNLGLCAASLIVAGKTAYMAAISNLTDGGKAYGIPLLDLVHCEKRDGKDTYVIKKALVDLNSPAYQFFKKEQANRDLTDDDFTHPGPIQFFGDKQLTDCIPETVSLNQGYRANCFDLGVH